MAADGQERKVSTTIYMTPEQEELLKALSAVTKVSRAIYIRGGIDLVLERELGVVTATRGDCP